MIKDFGMPVCLIRIVTRHPKPVPTYGLAYGLNHHLLDTSYLPVVRKAWKALTSTVDQNGKVGWVQPIGADPKKVTREMTAVYGVGAFLMAGTEIIKLIE